MIQQAQVRSAVAAISLVVSMLLPSAAQAATAFGVTATNNLIRFDTMSPGATASVAITGLQPAETIFGIDIRPADKKLYALGSTGRIYTINITTGTATMVSTSSVALSGTAFGVDFNPVADRLRVASNTGQNLRINVDTGVAIVDVTLAYATGDTNQPTAPQIAGSAYTNSVLGATTTTLHGIDTNLDILATQNPPNNGTLNTIGVLGVDATAAAGFDIEPVSAIAFAALNVGGVERLYQIDLNTGAASLVGNLGAAITCLAVASSSYTASLAGTTATFNATGDATIIIDQLGGLLRHNRFSSADSGFNSDFDFDSSTAGDQTLTSTDSSATIVINASSRDDIVVIGSASRPASTVAAAIVVNGGTGADKVTIEDTAGAATAPVLITSDTVFGICGALTYGGLEQLNINAGTGDDLIIVDSAAVQTNILSGAGNDTVIMLNGVSLNGGIIDGGTGTNALDYSSYGAAASVNSDPVQTVFQALISSRQEPAGASSSSASGFGSFVLNSAQTALAFSIDYFGVQGATITGTHFHNAATGVNGPIVRGLTAAEQNGLAVPDGAFSGTWSSSDTEPLSAALATELLADRIYFNLHSDTFPSGEIRGQMLSQGLFGTATGTAGVRAFPSNPVITWPAPASITFGVPLSDTQLNATANTPGTFTYMPPAGTVLALQTQTLTVLFTPTDTVNFTTATASVSIGVVNAAPVFASAPLASPSTAVTGQPVSFAAAATDNDPIASYAWDFGDSTTGTGSAVTHTYSTAGTYTVTVVATDSGGLSASSSVQLVVTAAGNLAITDSDNDGFSDAIETVAGTSPLSAAQTPFGSAPAGAALPLPDVKLSIKLNFAKPASDAISLSGSLLLSEGFDAGGKTMLVQIGDLAGAFTLDEKGVAKTEAGTAAIKSKGTSARIGKFAIKLSRGDFANSLAAAGLVNQSVTADVNVPLTVIIDGKLFQKLQAQVYKAKAGKSGSSKDKK